MGDDDDDEDDSEDDDEDDDGILIDRMLLVGKNEFKLLPA